MYCIDNNSTGPMLHQRTTIFKTAKTAKTLNK